MRYCFFVLFFLLAACGDADTIGGKTMAGNQSLIQIQLHQNIQDLISNSPLKFEEECMAQVNMCWYKISASFNSETLPSVVVDKDLKLDQVASVSIAVDKDVGPDIENIELSIKSLPDNSKHEAYQAFLYELMKEIKAAGWKHYYSPSDPRISGSQNDKVATPNKILGDYVLSHPWLDPDYQIDVEQWLEVNDFYNWHFFKDGNHLKLQAWRHDSEDLPKERGTYLVSLNFTTEREYWVASFSETKDKARWKELLPARLKEFQKIRNAREKKAVDAGIEIDTSYQDPAVKALN
ncbi:hypothetical protein FBY12_3353 [Pseudomonas sp. SJZ131]|nr:hypothetical protein FBY12_3353 [Pseudomonas sp. SJZ131]